MIVGRMEKKTPHCDLSGFQLEFTTPLKLRMTLSSERSAADLWLSLADVITVIQSMRRAHFYKSMTTYADHTTWHDVYHVPRDWITLYVKLTIDAQGRLIVSLKEK